MHAFCMSHLSPRLEVASIRGFAFYFAGPRPPAPPQLQLCSCPSRLLLSQVDGPSHFVALPGGGRRPNGATLLKRRLLGRVGLRVVSVPYWEWDTCAGPAEQATYLRRLLLESR